ncbi:MAG: hypothetical protein ACQEUT_15750 [Bacillota bacterium]
MNKLAEKLQPFIEGAPNIKIEEDEFLFEVVDVDSGDVYGFVHMEEGRFAGFEKMESEEDEESRSSEQPDVDKILQTAQLFVETFSDREVHFSMLNEWSDNNYMVTYEERDPKLGVHIPHTGCTLYFTRDGILTSANMGQTDVLLEYPDIMISSEDAKKVLTETNYVQLALHITDIDETDWAPELVYRPSYDIISISVDGRVEKVTEFMGADELSTINITNVRPLSSLEDMLGVSEDLLKRTGEEDSVIWIDPLAEVEEDGEEEPLISITSNDTGHFSFSNLPYVKNEEDTPLSMEMMRGKALEVLELAEGNIHSKFVLEEPVKQGLPEVEESLGEVFDEDEFYPEPEPTQMFSFYREHGGLRIDGVEAHVHVGIYTGLIRECSVTRLDPKQTADLEKLNMKPAITLKEAQNRIFSEIEMKLARCVKEFEDPKTYTLCYMVDFPGTSGHIQKINAHTGDVSYVDTGILKESD